MDPRSRHVPVTAPRTRRRLAPALAAAALLASGPSPARAVDLDLGRLEASVYSLPNVRAHASLGIDEDSFVVSEFADPVLAFPWRQVDHSSGVNAASQVTVRLWEDVGFPLGESPEWKEVVDRTVVLENRRRNNNATHDREGRLRLPVHLTPADPVRRLKVELISKVDSPFFTDVQRDERSFYLTLRPNWKSREHHHPALMQMIAMAYRRKQAAWRWKTYLRQVQLATRSLKDARRFHAEGTVRQVLEESAAFAKASIGDDVLEQVTEDLLAESGKAMGRLRAGIDSVSRELLGVRRLQFTALDAAERAWQEADSALGEAGAAGRNFVVAFRESATALEVRESLDRAIYHIDRELEALTHLWYITSDAELALLLSRYEESLRLEDEELVGLGKKLEQELGRDYDTHDWKPIGLAPIYRERFSRDDPDRATSAQMLRAAWFGLYYLIRTEHFALGVLAQAAARAREGFDLDAPKAKLLPAFEDENTPPHLQVHASVVGAKGRPGDLAEYPITVRNLDRFPREVVLRQVGPLPSGWFGGFSESEFTLAPGEEKNTVFTVTSPFYLQENQEVTVPVRIYFADEPERYHEPVFTSLAYLDDLPVLPPDGASHLDIEVLASERTMRPGEVAKYTYLVTHNGPTKKLVACELLSAPPPGWIAVLDPERLWLEPGETARVDLRVTAPLYLEAKDRQEWVVGIAYADEFQTKERIAFTTLATNLHTVKAEPHLNGDVVRTYFVKPGQSATAELLVQNKGNVKDTFDFFVDLAPEGWYVRLDKAYIDLPEFSPVVALPLRIQAPATAKAGDFVEVGVTAVSATHPEIREGNRIRLAIVGDPQLKMAAEGAPYRVAPGDALRFSMKVENDSDGVMKLGFRPAKGTARPGWISMEAPVAPLAPGEQRRLHGVIRPPESERIGDRVPFAIAAVNELGEEVAQLPFDVDVSRKHEVDIVLDDSRTLTSKGLVAVKLIVTNLGTVEDTVQLLLSGLKRRYWARLSHPRVRLAPDERKEVTLMIRIPPRADRGQDAVVEVQAKSAHDSKARDYVSVTVQPNGTSP